MRFETERLILRPIEEGDAPALFPLINDPDVAAPLLVVPHPYPEEELAPWIVKSRKAIEQKEQYEIAIILKKTGLAIGICSILRVSWEHMNAELGYWLGKKYWGQGYMTEAVKRLVEFGFYELDLERIYGRCLVANRASARIMEKAGLIYEGLAKHEVKKGDEFRDLLHYGLIREDFINEA